MNLRLSENWRQIVLGSLVLPGSLTAINYVTQSDVAIFSALEQSFLIAVSLVVQLGLAGWVLAALNLPQWIRTLIYVWCLGLVNIQVMIMALNSSPSSYGWADADLMPAAALFAGQIGTLWAWGILGNGYAIVRLPLCAIPAWALWCTWTYCTYDTPWHTAITLQVSALVSLCLVLRVVGFRLSKTESDQLAGKRFGLQHMLLATTLLAVIFALSRAGAPFFGDAFSGIRLWKILLALTSAFGMVVAVWAALGKKGSLTRTIIFTVLALLAGILFWNDFELFLTTPNPWRVDRERYVLAQLGAWWVGWFLISPAILTSILLYWRFTGYQFSRGSAIRA